MDWSLWTMLVLASIAGGVIILWGVSGYYHIRYYIRRRHEPEAWKCQPNRFLRPEQLREAMYLSKDGGPRLGPLFNFFFDIV